MGCSFCFDGRGFALFLSGSRVGVRIGKVLPLTPTVKIDQRLHAAPFCYFAREPIEVYRLIRMSVRINAWMDTARAVYLCQEVVAASC